MTGKEALKHALVSILVGAAVAFITTLLQGLLHLIPHLNLEPTGTVAGAAIYLVKTLRHA